MAITESTEVLSTGPDRGIKLYKWVGDSAKRGAVQIAHGMGEHALRYRPIAQALASAGYDVYANDHRGHGELAAQSGQLGDFGEGGFGAVVADMVEVTHLAREEAAGKPLLLLGHSMGSFAAQLYILDHSRLVDGVALSGSAALDLLGAAAATGAWRLEDLNASFEPARTPFDWLSRDEGVVDAYIADPLCGFNVSPESYGSMFSIAPRLANLSDLTRIRRDLPLFLFVGELDPVNAKLAWFRPLVDRYRQAGVKDVSWHVYGGARHEVLNETNRNEVIATLLAWIDRVVATNRRP
jgi:alpha-beta hydrolase superfamily lysophospholipase